MAGITLAQAEAQLALWMAANEAVSMGQSYSIGNQSLTRAHSAEILRQIEFWDKKVKELTRGGVRFYNVVPG